eukprot:COSAG04_NODE_6280_length_1366_cov_2.774270_1_plen_43_part_10
MVTKATTEPTCWYNGARNKGHTAASRYAAREERIERSDEEKDC